MSVSSTVFFILNFGIWDFRGGFPAGPPPGVAVNDARAQSEENPFIGFPPNRFPVYYEILLYTSTTPIPLFRGVYLGAE